MAEILPRRQGPLDDRARPAVAIALLPPAARFAFRGGGAAVAAAGACFGVELPRTACRAATGDGRAALWLGPDEWLLLAPEDETAAIAADLGRALGALPHALVDIGHRQVALAIEGPAAAPVLNAFCPLDLDPSAFPIGMCTRTILGKAEIVLWRRAEARFHVEVWRSFAAYVRACLAEAAREFTD